jgi:hypothetical protein
MYRGWHNPTVTLKRKLVAGSAALLVAGGAAGAGLAASGHGATVAPTQLRLESTTKAGFLRASAHYLGVDLRTLRHEEKAGRTLAEIADATPGRSSKELAGLLVTAAKLRLSTDRAFSPSQQHSLRSLLRHRITGFLNDMCPLSLGAVAKHLGGCSGMMMA